jgi:hypothetical protein
MDHIYVTDDITNILLGKDSPGTENSIFDPFSAGCMIMEEKRLVKKQNNYEFDTEMLTTVIVSLDSESFSILRFITQKVLLCLYTIRFSR